MNTPTPESLSAAAACLLKLMRQAEDAGDQMSVQEFSLHYANVTQAADWFAQRESELRAVDALIDGINRHVPPAA